MVVLILASLFRPSEEERRRTTRRSAPRVPREGSEQPQRMDAGEAERFLEELRSRQAARQQEVQSNQETVRRPTAVPVAQRQRREPRPSRTVSPPVRTTSRPAPSKLAAPVEVIAVAVVTEPPPAQPLPPPPPPAAPTVARERPASAAQGQLLALLRSPNGLRTAFMLREILDMPVCRRRSAHSSA